MKTRDRILVASLALFNEEGEAHTTTIDIAAVLDISPGNLYYHFRGKDQIIQELFAQFEQALGETLKAPLERPLGTPGKVEDNWYYLYVVLEDMWQYRFFYHNLDNILQRYPDIRRSFRRLLQRQRETLLAIGRNLLDQAVISVDNEQLQNLVDNMSLTLTFWFSYEQLLCRQRSAQLTIHQGVLQLLTLVAPYLGNAQLAFYRDCQAISATMLQQARP
ncbi:TetR/AcrR family transcriptional regulator [Kineobactrum salinum]|uniref:TetR/AcrR family transcriptional regulator n=1 Tax=Kineobactrum salinum TaxID=2708301 RepID=A0A6C0TZM3_9GAMM|nr:TetR/AcrR family transcriptional regulator [Kineobactrum salinum]QIB65231.1 TetR/AcrR family transcriptional regulator [Kineobactrum salinum]